MNKTPISILQELMVQRKQSIPDYHIENCGDKPGFKCIVKVNNVLETCGYGATKKDAKQDSALKALNGLGFTNGILKQSPLCVYNQVTTPSRSDPYFINYVGKLNEYASTHAISYPTYTDDIVPMSGKVITHCYFSKWRTEGHGLKKKDSKQDAARKMLEILKTEDVLVVTEKVENLNLEKIEKLNKLSNEILKNYEKLSIATNNVSSIQTEIKPIPNLKKNVTNLEGLKSEMEKYGHKSTLEIFQSEPYIMKMIIDTNTVFMGSGNTKEEAMTDLFETAVLMLSHGFSMSTEF